MATKVKSTKKYRKGITKGVGELHDGIINFSDDLVEGTITTAGRWQKLWSKAIKNSEPMLSKQIDIVYNTLHAVKGQFKVSGKRIKGLIKEDVSPAKNKKVSKKAKSNAKKKKDAREFSTKKDNLKIITGIGPKLEEILNNSGIKTYKQLAASKISFLKQILESAGNRYSTHNPSNWAAQAKIAARGNMAKLKDYQANLNSNK